MERQVSAYLSITYQYFNYLVSVMNDARFKSDSQSRIVMAQATVRKKKENVLHKIPANAPNKFKRLYSHCTLLHVSARGPG